MQFRIWPAGLETPSDVITLRLKSPLTNSQVTSLNDLLKSTDYTIEKVYFFKVHLLSYNQHIQVNYIRFYTFFKYIEA